MRAIAYLRVSTDERAREGVSLDAQRERVDRYCAHRGLELVEVVTEAGVSASKPLAARPGGRRVAEALGAGGAAHVVALKIDRLFRDTADALEQTRAWDRAGVALHIVDMGSQAVDTSSPMGRMMLTMIAAFAELERGLIVDRTNAALRHLKAQCRRTGGVPLGSRLGRDGRTLEPDEAELAAVRLARRLRGQGMSLRAVSARLAELGHLARGGRPYGPGQVSRMVDP